MFKYLKVWLNLTSASFQSFFLSRVGAVLFLSGKIIRFSFYLLFLVMLVSKSSLLAGFTLWQVIFFYMTYNLIDSTTQMLFREVYRFRSQVLSGDFDYILLKPVNPLFRILFGGADFLDLITLVPFCLFIIFVGTKISGVTIIGVFLYIALVLNALVIATSFHIFVMALAVLTTEIDHAIMIYRDFISMGRMPVDIYAEPLRFFITFIIPVGLMMTFPVKAMSGLISFSGIITAFVIALGLLFASMGFWRFALSRYTSASS